MPVLESIAATVTVAGTQAANWISRNPRSTAGIATSAVVMIAPALVTAPFLAVAGFGAAGVQAGSIAAGVQAGVGNVAAGSVFAVLQSAGAGGAGIVAVNGVVQGGTVVVAGLGWLKSRIAGR